MTPRDEAAVEATIRRAIWTELHRDIYARKITAAFAAAGFVVLPAAEAVCKENLQAEVAALRAELAAKDARLAEVTGRLLEVCDDLEREVDQRYPADLRAIYPSCERRWERDMSSALEARATLQAAPAAGQDGEAGL